MKRLHACSLFVLSSLIVRIWSLFSFEYPTPDIAVVECEYQLVL